ncbi:MAG: AAA family ATPase [Candidatus Omnitrophota bacterium]
MYEQYWNLKEKPFQNTPNPRYLYLSTHHEDALMKLTYVIAQGLGCGMLTGVFGCGKTLLGRSILNDLGSDRYRYAYIINPCVSEPAELLRAIVRGFSPQALPEKKTELLVDPLLEKLHKILIENIQEGRNNVVIIDEAHTIEDMRLFEQMRLILNFQLADKFLLTLLILGQPELRSKVEALKPFDQRVVVRCHLTALEEKDIDKYISHRLKVAGLSESPDGLFFDQEAIKVIFQHTGGIPRRINTLCDFILMSGFAKKIKKIDLDFIKSVIKDFNLG